MGEENVCEGRKYAFDFNSNRKRARGEERENASLGRLKVEED